jgi:hypothetical protein
MLCIRRDDLNSELVAQPGLHHGGNGFRSLIALDLKSGFAESGAQESS